MRARPVLLTLLAVLLASCLSMKGELQVNSPSNYRLILDYTVDRDFASLLYMGGEKPVIPLFNTEEGYSQFASGISGLNLVPNSFTKRTIGNRERIRVQLTMSNPQALEDLLSCSVVLEGNNPYNLTLIFTGGGGSPSEETVSYINGYCAGEEVSFTLTAPGGQRTEDTWSLRELLLEPQSPSISVGWRN